MTDPRDMTTGEAAAWRDGAQWGQRQAMADLSALKATVERQAAEIASLRLTLGGRTYSADVPEPIGCPCPGACVQVAEIGRLQAEREWRPIETAPKVGPPMLGVVDGDVRLIMWTKTSHVPIWGWCLVDQGSEDCDLCKPTHWQPLPPPPPAQTRARAPAAAPGCRAPAEAREAVSGEISGQCGGVR